MNTDRPLTEQFIGRINDDDMADEILWEVTMPQNIDKATMEHELIWVCRVEVHGVHRSMVNSISRHG